MNVKGIKLISEQPGTGAFAKKGSEVTYNARLFLRRGDEVTFDAQSIALYRDRLPIRLVDGEELVDHTIMLGKRQSIAAVEKSLHGMQPGSYREVMASAHLCYGAKGVNGRIPANAMLQIKLWVQTVV